jgi:Ca2+-binding EF-hand superfamily protein
VTKLVERDGKFTQACETALREMFDRLDEDMDGYLGQKELNRFQQEYEGCDVDAQVGAMLRCCDAAAHVLTCR